MHDMHESLSARIRSEYPADRVRDIAASGHRCLANIARREDFTEPYLRLKSGRRVYRSADYACVRWSGKELYDSRLYGCPIDLVRVGQGIADLGARIEGNLNGARRSRSLTGENVYQGFDVYEGLALSQLLLVSLGPVPMFLEDDGLMLLRVANDDAIELRIACYANLVRKDELVD